MEIINTQHLCEKEIIAKTSDILKGSTNFILMPTDTVYGLCCLWGAKEAEKQIYKAKKRPASNPLQMLASDIQMLRKKDCIINKLTKGLIENFCPGAITIVVPCYNSQNKIGFRIPKYNLILKLIEGLNIPLAATSANVSGGLPAKNVETALEEIAIKPNLVIDGGKLPDFSKASTVVEVLDNNNLKILRLGEITKTNIREKIKGVKIYDE